MEHHKFLWISKVQLVHSVLSLGLLPMACISKLRKRRWIQGNFGQKKIHLAADCSHISFWALGFRQLTSPCVACGRRAFVAVCFLFYLKTKSNDGDVLSLRKWISLGSYPAVGWGFSGI